MHNTLPAEYPDTFGPFHWLAIHNEERRWYHAGGGCRGLLILFQSLSNDRPLLKFKQEGTINIPHGH
jgi:hypothetical protein